MNANDGSGYGWSRIAISNIVVDKDSIVAYGVTNARGNQWEGTWFSATDFQLKQVKPLSPKTHARI